MRPLLLLALLAALTQAVAAEPKKGKRSKKTRVLDRAGDTRLCETAKGLAGWRVGADEVWSLHRVLEPRKGRATVRAVVVSFYATWCKPCVKGLKTLHRLAKSQRGAGVRFVLVAIPPFPRALPPHLKEIGVDLPVIKDKFGSIWERWTQRRGQKKTSTDLPLTVVLDRKQRLVKVLGSEGADFAAVIKSALKDADKICSGEPARSKGQ